MKKRAAPTAAKSVREPVQVYLAPDDSDLLNRLAAEAGLSKAEILRRGVRSFAREQGVASPMLRFLAETEVTAAPDGVAVDHDAILASAYRSPARKSRKRPT